MCEKSLDRHFGTTARQVGGDHYVRHAIQPWDVIEEYDLNFFTGNAVKYLLRDKPGTRRVEDLQKAIHYIEHEIARSLALEDLIIDD